MSNSGYLLNAKTRALCRVSAVLREIFFLSCYSFADSKLIQSGTLSFTLLVKEMLCVSV